MSLIRKSLALGVATIVAFSTALVVFELFFGGWFQPLDPWEKVDSLNVLRSTNALFQTEHIFGPGSEPAHYTRDEYGLRGSCSNPADLNVVTIGGSTTDQRYISDDSTWQEVMQAEIRAILGSNSFCVSNAGVDGHSTHGHVQALESWFPLIPGFEPEVYLLYVGINDAGFRDGPNIGFDSPRFGDWTAKSATYQALFSLRSLWRDWRNQDSSPAFARHSGEIIDDGRYSETELSPNVENLSQSNSQGFRKRLETILRSIGAAGGTPICVSQPHQFTRDFSGSRRGVSDVFRYQGESFNGLDYDYSLREINVTLAEVCTENGGQFVDLTDEDFGPTDFYDFVHMTPEGAKKVGEKLAAELYPSDNEGVLVDGASR